MRNAKLYSYWRSSASWRVRTVLEWKKLPYELVAVNVAPEVSEQRSDRYAAVNPLRQVPTLEWQRDDGTLVRLTQSIAIAEYLEETRPEPPLLPEDPLARAFVRQAVEVVNAGIQPLQNTGTLAAFRKLGGEAAAGEWASDAIARGLTMLEGLAAARGGRYSVGDTPTLADVCLFPQLYNARRFGVALDAFPRLLAIEARLAELAPFDRARPERQPDAVHTQDTVATIRPTTGERP